MIIYNDNDNNNNDYIRLECSYKAFSCCYDSFNKVPINLQMLHFLISTKRSALIRCNNRVNKYGQTMDKALFT